MLLRATVVINLVPFVYIFLALMTLDTARAVRARGGRRRRPRHRGRHLAAFLPAGDVGNVWIFELKMALGVGVPIGVGGLLAVAAGVNLDASSRPREINSSVHQIGDITTSPVIYFFPA